MKQAEIDQMAQSQQGEAVPMQWRQCPIWEICNDVEAARFVEGAMMGVPIFKGHGHGWHNLSDVLDWRTDTDICSGRSDRLSCHCQISALRRMFALHCAVNKLRGNPRLASHGYAGDHGGTAIRVLNHFIVAYHQS